MVGHIIARIKEEIAKKLSITDSINRLYQIKCLDIVNGKVCLCEKMWGKR